jgi:glutamate-1-semialdehyde 2,1-aminomutase
MSKEMNGPDLYRKAKNLIPGGTQLLSKRGEMFLPEYWPSYYSKAKDANVWDISGKKYIDMSYSAVGACILGYADDDVNAAVNKAIADGSICTLNCPEEVELAELLTEIHPWSDQVRYARTGGEAMAIAVRIARSKTKKDIVAFCGYHGWHDWYISSNLGDVDSLDGHLLPGLSPNGVPRALRKTAIPFRYNHINELEKIVSENGDNLAAIVMEPVRNFNPENSFLEDVRRIATDLGIPLVFDEVTSGWRLTKGGVHLEFGVFPDIAVFGKGMSNGYPMAAVIGRKEVMEAAQESFISSTYWTDRIGPVAAIATIKKILKNDVPSSLIKNGQRVQSGWQKSADESGLEIEIGGMAPISHFTFKYDEAQIMKTLFVQYMLEKKYLATNAYYAMYAHTDEIIDGYINAVKLVFKKIAEAKANDNLLESLKGEVAHSGFKRLS